MALSVERCHLLTVPAWPEIYSSTSDPEHIVVLLANTFPGFGLLT